VAYNRLKAFWGALDIEHSDESPYTAAQTKAMGTNAMEPGIGVRRAQLVFSRAGIGSGEDSITTSIDLLNMTGGSPDDTWTDSDFVSAEGKIDTWWNAIKFMATTKIVLDQIRWYRIGPGLPPPNPAVRVTDKNLAGTATASLPPQVAVTLTEKTVPRRQWGRLYLPLNTMTGVGPEGRIDSGAVTALITSSDVLYSGLNASELVPVVYSKTRGKAYAVETIQVDDLYDVIRSRRYDKPTIRETRPV